MPGPGDYYVEVSTFGTAASTYVLGIGRGPDVSGLASGLRTSAAQTVATVPLAALVAGGGLGVIINTGLATQAYGQVLAGGVLVAALTLGVDAVMGLLQRRLTPVPLRVGARAVA